MSKPRYDWWPYVKGMIRRYPALKAQYADLHSQSLTADYSGVPRSGSFGRSTEAASLRELPTTAQREYEAVRRAISATERCHNGQDRLYIIKLVLWDRDHTLEGAALMVPCSAITAKRWHGEFIQMVAHHYGLLD